MLDIRAAASALLPAADAIAAGEAIEGDLQKGSYSVLRHIIAQARHEAIEATRALIAADPTDVELGRKLRNDAQRFCDIGRWIVGALATAQDTYAALEPDEREIIDQFLSGQTEINDA